MCGKAIRTDGTAVGSDAGSQTRALHEARWASTGFRAGHWNAYLSKPRITTPAPTRRIPNHSLSVGHSCRKNDGKDAYQPETQLIHRYDLRPVTHLQGAEGADPRSTHGEPGQHPKEPGLRSEREYVTSFPDEVHDPRQGDNAYRRLPSPAHHDRRAGERQGVSECWP